MKGLIVISALEVLHQLFVGRPKLTGITLMGNVGALPDGPMQLDERCAIRRATPEEAQALGALVVHYGAVGDRPIRNPFETGTSSQPWESGELITWGPLDPEEVRYHVLDYSGSNAWPRHIVAASVLTGHELVEAFSAGNFGNTFGAGASRDLVRFMTSVMSDDAPFLSLSKGALEELAAVQKQLQLHDESILPLNESLREYAELRQVTHAKLVFLGLFTILEKLLTHQPRGSDRLDTITRQVHTKVSLLNRRFAKPLAYDCFKRTDKTTPETIWKVLYALRSAVAHGRHPDFASELQILVDFATAEAFVRSAVRAVMRQVLEEPFLVADLREC